MDIAREAGNKVALTLSDSFCVERHRDEWLDLIADRVDILFANESEIHALYGGDFSDCARQVAALHRHRLPDPQREGLHDRHRRRFGRRRGVRPRQARRHHRRRRPLRLGLPLRLQRRPRPRHVRPPRQHGRGRGHHAPGRPPGHAAPQARPGRRLTTRVLARDPGVRTPESRARTMSVFVQPDDGRAHPTA